VVGPLTELIVLTYGPHVVVADEFGDLQDVASVVIFGSWAALYRGRRGLSCGWTARSTRPSAPAPSGLIRLWQRGEAEMERLAGGELQGLTGGAADGGQWLSKRAAR